ncbi:hypothetical protein CXK93_12955 [Stutzerimonas decontaminans]|uniref:Uncharacterized protein n=1 Tax=Stutzerimonas decontaminans TaxID=3022791 RepID=A0ABX4W1D8_9GAMM|nr:hypothetical protein [Pseudomonas aeruginosa]PNF85160.1 hypothetical protein CXK93_12955 [Stutzerimonas decontaminans]
MAGCITQPVPGSGHFQQARHYDDVYMRFTCVSRTRSSLANLRLDAGRFSLASRFDLPKYRR